LYKDLAKAILKKYDLHPVIIMDKDLDVKAKYIPEEGQKLLRKKLVSLMNKKLGL